MKLFKKIYKWLGMDGMLHISCSTNIVVASGIFLSIWEAALVAITIGIAKELIWDKLMKKGEASWHDFICDVLGITAGAVILLLDS